MNMLSAMGLGNMADEMERMCNIGNDSEDLKKFVLERMEKIHKEFTIPRTSDTEIFDYLKDVLAETFTNTLEALIHKYKKETSNEMVLRDQLKHTQEIENSVKNRLNYYLEREKQKK